MVNFCSAGCWKRSSMVRIKTALGIWKNPFWLTGRNYLGR
jgi:hypothetical protein